VLSKWGLRSVLLLLGLAVLAAVGAAAYVGYWGDKTGGLALVSVAATLALAFAAVLTLQQNRAIVSTASAQAKAATDEATASRETVEEMRNQRRLAYRPWLVITQEWVRNDSGVASPPSHYFVVTNIGTGPAVNIRLNAYRFDDATPDGAYGSGSAARRLWVSAETGGVGPGGEWRVYQGWSEDAEIDEKRPDRFRCLVEDFLADGATDAAAVRYEDWFGSTYRSPGGVGHPSPVEWQGHAEGEAPDWMRCGQP
jgi:hypothetical protein